MIRGTTRVAAVIGWPVEHSRSPQMFAAAFATAGLDAAMIPIGVPPEGLAQVVGALRAMRALGASVTLPHKLAAAALCDELSPAARDIGAVNCLEFAGDRLIGHNTDAHGYTDALIAAGFPLAGARCVILGAGGAARGVAHGLRAAGAGAQTIIARRPEQASWAQARPWTADELARAFAEADLIVDSTPLGLGGDPAAEAALDQLPLDRLATNAWVTTLVYHREGKLLQRAKAAGHSILDGRGMLVYQGARAFRIWTGAPAPTVAMRQALEDAIIAGT